MSALPSPPPVPRALPPRGAPVPLWSVARWPTPRRLQGLLVLVWLGAILLFVAITVMHAQLYGAVKAVGRDAAPSILAAEEIRARFADLDANAANDLLGGKDGMPQARKAFEDDRQVIVTRLIDATQNITYGDEERAPIRTMNDQLGQYLALIAQARLLHNQDPNGVAAIETYRQATTLMHTTILPAAQALDDANQRHLDQAYRDNNRTATAIEALVYCGGILLLAMLIGTQIFLARRMRRLLNLPLAAASLLVLVLLLYLGGTFNAAQAQLHRAKQDALDSLSTLWRARAVAFDANGDESLYLLDKPNAAQYERSFRQKTAQLADPPLTNDLIAQANQGTVRFNGYFGDEMRNITFPGERDAAVATLNAFKQYYDIDGQIRSLETAGTHADAIALNVGTQPGQSNYAFDRYDQALGNLIDINQRAFDGAIADSFAGLRALPLLGPVGTLIIAFLAWAGLQPRLREYAV